MTNLVAIFVGLALINNLILAQFLGLCPFFGVSKKLGAAVSMGAAVTFVMVIACIVTWIITQYILIPFDVMYMSTVIYILVIASLVQIIEMFIMRTNYSLYNAFGIYLALITTNCAVLGITFITNIRESYGLVESIVAALGGGAGFTLVLAIMSGIRERLELADSPKSMKGLPIAFITATLLSLAFSGFAGMLSKDTTTTPATTTTPTQTATTVPPTATTPSGSPGKLSYDYHYIYTDTSVCFLCHIGDAALLIWTPEHEEEGRAQDSCLDAGCHELSQ